MIFHTTQDIAIPFNYFSRFIGRCKYKDEVIYSALPRFIYTANDQFEFKERYIIDYGPFNPHDEKLSRLTREQMNENVLSRANFGGAIHETDMYFYFDTIYKDELILSKYNKKTKQCTSYRISQNSELLNPIQPLTMGCFLM